MNRPILAALLAATAACQTPGLPKPDEAALIAMELANLPAADRAEVGVAVAAEIGARVRCPKGMIEVSIFTALRTAFDTLGRPRIQPESAAVVDRLRGVTNEVCGLS